MKNLFIKKPIECPRCEGYAFLQNEMGIVIQCPDCMINRKKYENFYGSDLEDTVSAFVDVENGVAKRLTKRDEQLGYIILKSGKKIYLN